MKYINRKPNRLDGFDYSSSNHYFVTICVKDFESIFGEVVDGEMRLNDLGRIAHNIWREIPYHFQYIHLDKFIIMPEHMHGIIEIKTVGASDLMPLPRFMTLPKIIQQYKSSVTREIKRQFPIFDFQWQRSYYDTIIKDEQHLENIREYIQNNPENYKLKNDY